MAEDYYERGKIKQPTIGLLAKTCLITAGNAWNRMQIQLVNKEYQRKMQEQEQDPHNYQQRPGFVQSDNLAPTNRRPPPLVVEKTKRQLQQEATNQVNTSVTEWGYPTITPRFDTVRMDGNKRQQQQPPHQSQPRPKNQSYYDEDYGGLS
ncbi:MAG: hypothetical protein M3Y53_01320 [Thermoproteota archaeon]|nr:hypothetical protein [Thermoproteota archaeon]